MGLGDFFSSSQETTMSPWGPAKPHLKEAMAGAGDAYGSTYGPSPLQQFGADYLGQYAGSGQLQGLLGAGMGSNQWLASGAAMSPDSNPYLRQWGDALAGDMKEDFTDFTLPGIQDEFSSAGQDWNSSRQGVREAVMADRLSENIGNMRTGLYSDAYGQGLNATMQGIGMMPGTAQAGAMPGLLGMQAGDYMDSTYWNPVKNYAGVSQGVGSMGGTQTQTSTMSPAQGIGLLGQFGTGIYGAMKYPEQFYGA